jgi:ribonucleotide reductase class II
MSVFIIKRDNTTQEYDIKKIENALKMAFANSSTVCDNMDTLTKDINDDIFKTGESQINIEDVQNIVEKNLMNHKYFNTAKHYIEYRKSRQDIRNTEGYIAKIPNDIETPWGMLGYITYKRTYARVIDENENTEEYRDTILRILRASQNQLKVGFTNNELKKAYEYMMSLKCSVAGRFAWQLGTKTVDKLGIMSLQNCAFVKIDEPIKPFLWIFDVLMLGTGVGFSIEKKYVEKLPPIIDSDITITRQDTNDADFIVPDSREGWVSLLEKVLEAYFYKGKSFTYSTKLIRSAGSKIHGFGGIASGPEDLVKGLGNIQKILSNRKGKNLTTVDCLDIVNIIATVVVAGNVRRCLPGNSMVHTQRGLKQIKDIKVGEMVLTSNGYDEVSNVFVQGKQDVITIKTQDGEFKCTPNHRMAVLTSTKTYKWKMAKDLRYNDQLMSTRNAIDGTYTRMPYSNEIIVPALDENMAWFVGFLQSKTPYEVYDELSYVSFKFDKNEGSILEKMKNIFYRMVDNDDFYMEIDEYRDGHSIISFKSKELFTYIMQNIVTKNNVPDYITQGTFNVRMSYLAGVVDGNGHNRTNYCIISDKLVTSIQNLCYSCGLETKIYKGLLTAVTNHTIASIHNIDVLIKKEYVSQFYNKNSIGINSFPIEMIKGFRRYDNIVKKFGYDHKNNITINTFEECFDEVSYCPVKVMRVECETEYVDTYDIEVKNYHEFYCNGYLTHNSALIALGDSDDKEYLMAKNWSTGNIPNWRCMSNNSIVCDNIENLPDEFWDGYNGTSEPYGLVNLELSKKCGRIKDGDKYPDPDVVGYNPCAEQSLANFETCCLSEIYLSNITSYEEMKEIATIVYRICKHSLSLKCHQKDTEDIVHKNMRMGIGITGYMQSTDEQKSWLGPLYEYLREYDTQYSDKNGFPRSVKITTVKPSGTLSLLAGVTSGCHPAIYQYFIRRIRIASNNPLIQLCKSKGYTIEYQRNFDGTDDKNTMIVEFPCCYPIGSQLAKDMTVIDQLETVKHLQTEWSDNSVSCTIYYKLHEIDDMKKWLKENYTNNVKTCSFLLHNEHGFQQAPFEEITEDKYNEMLSKVIPITSGVINTDDDLDYSTECVGGVCPIR